MSVRVPAEARTALARRAALLRHHPDRVDEIDAVGRQAKYATMADYITRTVDAAPPLTPEQRDRLALLLRGGAASEAAA